MGNPTLMRTLFFQHKSRLVVFTLAVLLCAIVGCGGPSSKIVGKWRTGEEANGMVWEFAKNRSVSMGDVRGRYSFGDQNRVKIETPFAISIYQMEFSGDQMTLRDPNGSKLVFTRIR